MNENRDDLNFFPCNSKRLIDISEDIISDEEIIAYITKNQFDSLEISWSCIFLHSVFHYLKTVDWSKYGEIKNSILFCALDNQTMQLMWILFSLCHGQYDLALRELRNIIENAFYCYRIDCQADTQLLSGANKFKKLSELPENETFGKRVFKQSGYADWENIYINIYKPLCEFTHTKKTIEKVKEAYPEYRWIEPEFDRGRIITCLYYFQKVILTEVDMMQTQLAEVYGIKMQEDFKEVFNVVPVITPSTDI